MSITITTIRHFKATQVSTYLELDLSEYYRLTPFTYLEIESVGWTGGARVRTKQFSNFSRLYAYLNKLHIHGWLDDDSYSSAWAHALCLEDNILNTQDYGAQED